MAQFENKQWAVTDTGMKTVEPGAPYEYVIDADRLLERRGNGDDALYEWPLHIAEKTWIDMNAFEEAFRSALSVHAGKYKGVVDESLLNETFVKAFEYERRTR